MQSLYVTYGTFKVCSAGEAVFWFLDGALYRLVFASLGHLFISCAGDADAADFAGSKVEDHECTSLADACALALRSPSAAPAVMSLAGPKTPDGRSSFRVSTANRATNFKLRAITFTTADFAGGVHNVNPVTDADYSDVTVTLYDVNGAAITDEANEGAAVKTVIDWEPHYNYEVIGGLLDMPTDLKNGTTNQWYISAIGVPDYPPQYYGSVDFISEVNLEAVTMGRVVSDGRAISYLPYQYGGMPGTNKLRFTVKHPTGAQKRFQLYLEHFV